MLARIQDTLAMSCLLGCAGIIALTGSARAECGAAPLEKGRVYLQQQIPPPTPSNTFGYDIYRGTSRNGLIRTAITFSQHCSDDPPEERFKQEVTMMYLRSLSDAMMLEAVPVLVDASARGTVSNKVKVPAECGPVFLALGRYHVARLWEEDFNPEFNSLGHISDDSRTKQTNSLAASPDYERLTSTYHALASAMSFDLAPLNGNQSAWVSDLEKKGKGAYERLSYDVQDHCEFSQWGPVNLVPM